MALDFVENKIIAVDGLHYFHQNRYRLDRRVTNSGKVKKLTRNLWFNFVSCFVSFDNVTSDVNGMGKYFFRGSSQCLPVPFLGIPSTIANNRP